MRTGERDRNMKKHIKKKHIKWEEVRGVRGTGGTQDGLKRNRRRGEEELGQRKKQSMKKHNRASKE